MVSKGPLKGKRVEDFMLEIFGFEPGEHLITDLSSLHDFVGVDDLEIGDMHTRIRDAYGMDVADLPNGNLLEIFKRLREYQVGARRDGRAH